jgi:hypothetical protein
MGTSVANSVVDSYGQSHEIPKLWVAGPSIFPTRGSIESDVHEDFFTGKGTRYRRSARAKRPSRRVD